MKLQFWLARAEAAGVRAFFFCVSVSFVCVACEAPPTTTPLAMTTATAATTGPLAPLPASLPTDPQRVALGRALFFDKRLSGDGTVACASCHDLAKGGDDGARVATGIRGQKGTINAPTVWNAAFNFAFFWDGRAATLEEQARGPVENPLEMGARWPDVIDRLGKDPVVVKGFAAAYKDGVTVDNVTDAIAEFERTLITPDAPFDRFLRGEAQLDDDAAKGFALFTSLGCVSCHQGRGVGGNMYQTFGVMGDYFKDRGSVIDSDLGRYNVTHNEQDRHVFKVPSLRNVEHTAPYFHDGSAATLDDAVRTMARYQLGRRLEEDAVQKLVAFLRSLSAPTATFEEAGKQ